MQVNMHAKEADFQPGLLLQLAGVGEGGDVLAVVQAQPSLLVQQDSPVDQVAPCHVAHINQGTSGAFLCSLCASPAQ